MGVNAIHANRQRLFLAAAAVLVTAVMAVRQCGWRPEAPGSGPQQPLTLAGAGLAAEVTRLEAQRDGEHVHLILTGKFRAEGAGPVRLESPAVRLLTPGGREVQRFLGPFLPEPVVAGGAEAEVTLHWWLASAEAAGVLTLDVSGATAELKDISAFSVDSLPNGQTVLLRFPVWQPLTGSPP